MTTPHTHRPGAAGAAPRAHRTGQSPV